MRLKFRPRTRLGKISAWGILYFFFTWVIVAVGIPRLGVAEGNRGPLAWLFFFLAVTGMLGAFVSTLGGFVALVWREDRSFWGYFLFLLSIPVFVMLASFLLGSYLI